MAAIQGNVPRARNLPQQLNDTEVTQNHAAATDELAADVKAGRLPAPDLVIWPENSTDLDPGEYPAIYATIARAVAARPGVLLLDEPAAGLGSAESLELSTLVRRLADDWGMTILLVEHDMEFVMSVCDEIAVMEFGAKIAQGRPAEIRKDPAVIAAYLGNELDPGAMAELA